MADTIYYEVTGNEPLEFCRDWRERAQAVTEAYGAYAEAKGGIGHVRLGRGLGGVIFKGEPPVGWREHRTPCRDGARFAKPVKRGAGAAEGKALQAEIDALPKLPSDDEFCDRFSFPRQVEYTAEGREGFASIHQGFWQTAQIAWIDKGDSFYIVLPDFAGRVAELEAKGWVVTPREWKLPAGLKPSSRARYELAQAAAKVAAEEAMA